MRRLYGGRGVQSDCRPQERFKLAGGTAKGNWSGEGGDPERFCVLVFPPWVGVKELASGWLCHDFLNRIRLQKEIQTMGSKLGPTIADIAIEQGKQIGQ